MAGQMKRAEEWRVVDGRHAEITVTIGDEEPFIDIRQDSDIVRLGFDDVPALIEALQAAHAEATK